MAAPPSAAPANPATSATSKAPKTFDKDKAPEEYPVLFLSHAAPVLFMDDGPVLGARNDAGPGTATHQWYKDLPTRLGLTGARAPRAIVMVSAHYETPGKTVLITAQDKYPKLYYDFYGFPDHLYHLQYPAPGNNALARRIQALLGDAGVEGELDMKRNLDHGVFMPLMLMYPEANIPVVTVSISSSMDPDFHIKLGRALRPLRKEGVLIVGSGQATHGPFNLFGNKAAGARAKQFVDALTAAIIPAGDDHPVLSADGGAEGATVTDETDPRVSALRTWKTLPHAQEAHPRADHFAPLFSVVGASRPDDTGHVVGDQWLMQFHSLRTFAFGEIAPK